MSFFAGLLLGSAVTGITLFKKYTQRGISDYKRGYEDCYDTYLDFRTHQREEYRKLTMSSL